MATKSALESQNIALKAQLAQLAEQVAALTQAQPAPKPAPKAPEPPRVVRSYFKRKDESGNWVPNQSAPCIEIKAPGMKQRMSDETFRKMFIEHHERLVKEFLAL